MNLARLLPNLFTQANLFCGFIGILNVIHGNLLFGSTMVFLAAVFDLLDGMVARMTKTQGKIGAELDSLADVVSFGILPSVIMHILIIKTHSSWIYSITFANVPLLSLFPFAIAAGSAYRLAKFNVSTEQSTYFKGLPTPAAGIFFASLPLILAYDLLLFDVQTIYLKPIVLNPFILLILALGIPLLMISTVPMFAFKFRSLSWKENSYKYIFLAMAALLFVFLSFAAIPVIILLYILMSIVLKSKINEVHSRD